MVIVCKGKMDESGNGIKILLKSDFTTHVLQCIEKAQNPSKVPLTEAEQLKLEDDLYKAKIVKNCSGEPAKKTIPRFFNRLPKETEVLRQRFREETRANFLKRKSKQLLDNNELRGLWTLLDQNQSKENGSNGGQEGAEVQLLSYREFKKVAEQVDENLKPYLKPSVFLKLQQGDPQGRISVVSLFNYTMRKVWLQQTRIGLSVHDVTGQGFLRDTDLESYIAELLPTLPQLEGLEKSFQSFYICTAVRKFLFFLGRKDTGRVRILDILACSFLDDLLELRVEDLSKEVQEQNWFSAPSALRVYGHYLNLDRDHNGMLSLSELSGYGSGTLTQPFLERVFQICLTYGGEMDYKTYLDLVLALENRAEPQSLAFLFRVLDLNGHGYLDAFTLNYFFRAIQDQIRIHSVVPVNFNDVKDELFDMVKPQHPDRITLNDLIASGNGDTFVSILIEFHGFWAYENREAMAAEPSQD